MPPHAAFHLGLHCLPKYLFTGIQNKKGYVVNVFLVSQMMQYNNYKFERKIVNIFLPISFNICFGCSKEPSH